MVMMTIVNITKCLLFIDVEMLSCKFDKTKLRDCRTDVLFIEPEESVFAIDLTGTAAVAINSRLE